jgi:hypothetical protein
MNARRVFYQPRHPGIIDTVRTTPDGVTVSETFGETLDQIRKRYPGAELGELDKVLNDSEEAFRHAPQEITQERFIQMLEVLPPVGWKNAGRTESFKLCERTFGHITAIFARIGEKYYELADRITLSHDDIINAIEERTK